jgi:hypothetical protein
MLSRELSSPHLNVDGHTSTNLSMFVRAIHKVVQSVQSLYVEIHDVILVSTWHTSTKLPALSRPIQEDHDRVLSI